MHIFADLFQYTIIRTTPHIASLQCFPRGTLCHAPSDVSYTVRLLRLAGGREAGIPVQSAGEMHVLEISVPFRPRFS